MDKKICKHYDEIVNCEFLDDDVFSKILVQYYKNTVNKETNAERLTRVDYVVSKYINDYNFSRKLQNTIDVSSIVRCKTDLTDRVLDYVLDFSSRYDGVLEETIENSRWI